MYMGNLDASYTADHWMRDFVCKLMGLSHKTLLARNLMKHDKTKGKYDSHQGKRGIAEGSGQNYSTMLVEH